MAFFGAVVKPGPKPTPVVPHPDEGMNLHLSQACLMASTPKGKRVSLMVHHEGEDPVCVATLTAGSLDSIPLDLFFSEYIELTLEVRAGGRGGGGLNEGGCSLPRHEATLRRCSMMAGLGTDGRISRSRWSPWGSFPDEMFYT